MQDEAMPVCCKLPNSRPPSTPRQLGYTAEGVEGGGANPPPPIRSTNLLGIQIREISHLSHKHTMGPLMISQTLLWYIRETFITEAERVYKRVGAHS